MERDQCIPAVMFCVILSVTFCAAADNVSPDKLLDDELLKVELTFCLVLAVAPATMLQIKQGNGL